MRGPAVHNRHERSLDVPPGAAGALLDGLAGPDDRLWPGDRWPPMRLDGPLRPGASGGHAFVRYRVEAHRPGTSVTFGFTGPRGLTGIHRFDVAPRPGGCVLSHTIEGRVSPGFAPAWYLAVRPLHDALIEDALDRAERETTGTVRSPARWSGWVRILRRLAARRAQAPGTSGLSST